MAERCRSHREDPRWQCHLPGCPSSYGSTNTALGPWHRLWETRDASKTFGGNSSTRRCMLCLPPYVISQSRRDISHIRAGSSDSCERRASFHVSSLQSMYLLPRSQRRRRARGRAPRGQVVPGGCLFPCNCASISSQVGFLLLLLLLLGTRKAESLSSAEEAPEKCRILLRSGLVPEASTSPCAPTAAPSGPVHGMKLQK